MPLKCTCPNCEIMKAEGNKVVNLKKKRLHNCHYKNCGEVFQKILDLKNHIKIHIERPHACEWPGCNKKYVNKHSVKVHMLSHTGERPYACEWPSCNKKFKQKSNLDKHVKRIHNAEKNYVCDICYQQFIDKSNLKMHVEIHILNNSEVKESAVTERDNEKVGIFSKLESTLKLSQKRIKKICILTIFCVLFLLLIFIFYTKLINELSFCNKINFAQIVQMIREKLKN